MSKPISLFCLIYSQPFARAFPVKINKDDTVGDLKKLIITEKPNYFQSIDADQLDLWKVEIPITDDDETPQKPELRERKLGPAKKIGKLFSVEPAEEHVHIIIRGPSPGNVVAAEHQEPELIRVGSNADQYRTLVTVNYSGAIPNVNWEDVASKNELSMHGDLPQFIKDIVDKARPAPDDESKELLSAFSGLLSQLQNRAGNKGGTIDAFARVYNNLFSETDTGPSYMGWNLEPVHFAYAAALSSRKLGISWLSKMGTTTATTDTELTVVQTRRLVLDWFETFWSTLAAGNGACNYGKDLTFSIMFDLDKEDDKYRKYLPRPDAAFLINNVPYFLAEIDSHANNKDKHRLIVYTACALRLLAHLKWEQDHRDKNEGNDNYDKNVFLMAAYFSKEWIIERYFFFMVDKNQVRRNHQTFNMKDPFQFTHFLREFYGYAHHIGEKYRDWSPDMTKVSEIIVGSIEKSLNTKYTGVGSNRRGNASQSSRRGGSGSKQKGTDAHDAMVDALKGSDYQLQDDLELLPLFDLPDHIAEARDSKQNRLIVKLVRNKRSNELRILKELCERQSRLNHVVPLVDTFMSSLGPLLILEQGNSLLAITFSSIRKDEASRLSRELIEGVAFLHGQNIAHMDIKPDNLVCSFKTNRLLIIDFDMAIECNSADELVDNRCCGTPGWCAPEIDLSGKKRQQAFSPIRADLWSCGMVLGHIARMGGYSGFGQLIKMLVVVDPRRRPLLHQVVDEESVNWTTDQLVEAFGCRASDKEVEETMLGGNKLKRSRDDVSSGDKEGLALKMVKRSAVSTDYSGGSETSASSGFSELPSPVSEILGYAKGEHIGHAGEISEKDGMYSDPSIEEMSVFSSNA